jgi:hypothetical protein
MLIRMLSGPTRTATMRLDMRCLQHKHPSNHSRSRHTWHAGYHVIVTGERCRYQPHMTGWVACRVPPETHASLRERLQSSAAKAASPHTTITRYAIQTSGKTGDAVKLFISSRMT